MQYGVGSLLLSDVVAISSTLSPVLAKPFMEFFELELLPSISLPPTVWLKYVDDVFALWPDDSTLFPDFLSQLNSFLPSILSKISEWEVDNKLPFFETLVYRSADLGDFLNEFMKGKLPNCLMVVYAHSSHIEW